MIETLRGGLPLRRAQDPPVVSIQPGERVFHRKADGAYEPATITLSAIVQNIDNPKYQWGRILNGSFRPYSVVLSSMTITPAYAGVIAVRVSGDNINDYVYASETISIIEDGASAIQYKIVVKQLDRIVTSISCDANGNPKLYYQATAYLYKITGSEEEPCGDFLCAIAYYKGDSVVKADISQGYVDNYTFIVDGDYDSVRIGFSDGENVIVETTIAKTYDGAPSEVYSIEILQNNKVVTTIASDAEGYSKLDPYALARLYKQVGNDKKAVCSNYYCKVVSVNIDDNMEHEEESGVPVSDYEFEVADNYYDYFVVSYFDKASKKTVAEITVLRTYDGSAGKPGENGVPGCVIRRSEWKSGIQYRNDEGLKTVNTRYIDAVLVRAKNALGWRGYKCLQTHVSTNDNAPGNTDYWEEFPTNTVGILASLIIARDAKLDFLSGNEIRILDANDKVTAGVSGSGSGDTGIRFYAGSDNPQNAPFRVNEKGELYSSKIHAEGEVVATSGRIGGMKIIGNTLQGLQSVFGEYSIESSGVSTSYSIVDNIDSQQIFILLVRRNASFFLPSKADLTTKGINENYSFRLSLIAQYQNGGTCELLCREDTKIIRNGIAVSSLTLGKGEAVDLFYHSDVYYVSSASNYT
mgnify:CR=1 FL=1|jgi:hypothetical protein|nr:MAG TPA: hypothetical protein [Caudoviricetes sp.]